MLSLEMLEMDNQPHLPDIKNYKNFGVKAFKDKSVSHTIDTRYLGSMKGNEVARLPRQLPAKPSSAFQI